MQIKYMWYIGIVIASKNTSNSNKTIQYNLDNLSFLEYTSL